MTLPQVIIDVGFTDPTVDPNVFVINDPNRGIVGIGELGPAGVWTDITSRVRSWSVQCGDRSGDDITVRYDPGTCSIELNDPDRAFDPDNLSGPFVLAGATQVEPMRRVRIRAIWDGITYPIFSGYADDWQPTYVGTFWTYVTLTATDALKIFAGTDRSDSTATGADETTGARINRILDSASWPAEDRSMATGDVTVQETTLSGNVLAELQLVQDTELGELYVDAAGKVVFRNRYAVVDDARSNTSQATFGDGGYPAEIPYADVKPSAGKALANTVTAARVGGLEQVVQDTVAAARYLVQTFSRSDLVMTSDTQALDWASLVLYRAANPRPRFAQLDFLNPRPDVEDGHWPQVLGRLFGDRITVKRRPKGGGTLTRESLIRGVTHESDGAYWRTSWVLESAEKYTFFTIGDADRGALGVYGIA